MATYAYHSSPIGELLLVADDIGRLSRVGLPTAAVVGGQPMKPPLGADADSGALMEVIDQLGRYFAGDLTEFDVEVHISGTAFQKAVWAALIEIPYGTTASYGQLATQIGRPGAARAVGMANRHNPVPIVVPCHRVIAADGALTGYAGPDGLAMKQVLLSLEAQVSAGGALGSGRPQLSHLSRP